jgi:dTDP-4-dehydrorhamnose reductase
MKKLLVTGASGFLGWHICQLAKAEWEIYSTYSTNSIEIPGVKTLKVDLTDFTELTGLFQNIQPNAVIHTAAQSQPNYCQLHPEETHKINVVASSNIAGLCADNSLPLAFTSSELVFDGLNSPYVETDRVCPVNIYGEQKVQAEFSISGKYPLAAICRMPLMFGQETPTAKSFMQPFIQALVTGKELTLFVDEFRTPVSAKTATKGLLLALEKVNGYIHLGGIERISRYEFGKLLVEVFHLPDNTIKPCYQKDVKMSAPRPADVSLNSSQAFALGYQPFSIKSELELLVNKI